MKKWLALVKLIGPLIVATVRPELGPVATDIVDAITEAEHIKGAPGSQKLAHVIRVADEAVSAAKGAGAQIDVASTHDAVVEATEAVVAVANAVERSKALPKPAPPTPSTPPAA